MKCSYPPLETAISLITGIPEGVLHDYDESKQYSVEQKLRWIDDRREKSRGEDMSYSLFGFFDAPIGSNYDESRSRARRRLLAAVAVNQKKNIGYNSAAPGGRRCSVGRRGPRALVCGTKSVFCRTAWSHAMPSDRDAAIGEPLTVTEHAPSDDANLG